MIPDWLYILIQITLWLNMWGAVLIAFVLLGTVLLSIIGSFLLRNDRKKSA